MSVSEIVKKNWPAEIGTELRFGTFWKIWSRRFRKKERKFTSNDDIDCKNRYFYHIY